MIKYLKNSQFIVTLTLDMTERHVNILNHESTKVFLPVLKTLQSEYQKKTLRGVIITSAKSTFLAGGDLDYLHNLSDKTTLFNYAERLKWFFRELETLGVPVVAAINGSALGSGFELTLACHHRLVVDSPKIALGHPEVGLGIMPGGGGVVRLTWAIGMESALEVLTSGKTYKPQQAIKLGLVHELVKDEKELIKRAESWILANPNVKQPWDKLSRIPDGSPYTNSKTGHKVAAANALIQEKTKGNLPAVQYIMNTISEALCVDFDTAMRIESRYFASLVSSKEARNMTKALWYEVNEAKDGSARPKGFGRFKAKNIAIIGAGNMGAGIALACANQGINVLLKDVSMAVARQSKDGIGKLLQQSVGKNELNAHEMQAILKKITPTDNLTGFEECDLVIETVFESLAVKRKVAKELEQVIHREAFIASNTNSLAITDISSELKHAENLIGLHFFSPVHESKLVEVIASEKTSDETIARAFDFVVQLKKVPICVLDKPGYFTTRVFVSYLLEGIRMLEEGIPPAVIESTGYQAGMSGGPLSKADEFGLPLLNNIYNQLIEYQKSDFQSIAKLNTLLELINTKGRKGKAAQKGFYNYDQNKRTGLWEDLCSVYPSTCPYPSDKELETRLLFVQAIEALRCFEEGILTNKRDGNLGSILGWGFPAFHGGVFQFIVNYGYKEFLDTAKELERKYGKRFAINLDE